MEQRPLLDLLAGRARPELADAVRARKERVIERWEFLVRETLPKADLLTPPQLRDDAPMVLEHVARSLASDQPRHTEQFAAVSSAHGQTRYDQHFDLRELLIEYDLLRATVLEEVIDELGRAATIDELVALNAAIDIMSRRSVLEYVQHQSIALQAATEAQSKYLSFLSHDLRGGLNGLFLMIEVLRRELAGEPKYAQTIADLDAMRRSLHETVGTMDRLLHAERFRKGKVQLKPGRIELRSFLHDLSSNFIYQANAKGLEMRLDVPESCVVTSDRELLTLILQNLLSNAVKYADGGEVVVSAANVPNAACRISVADQGPGIEPEKLDELFGSFTRGETHGQPGVGLGLSIARQAAEFIGARLWADSAPGHGSTFHVEIPSQPPQREQVVKREN